MMRRFANDSEGIKLVVSYIGSTAVKIIEFPAFG